MRSSAAQPRSAFSACWRSSCAAGLRVGDLYLVAPIGLMLGWPVVFTALFAAAFFAAGTSLVLLVTRRVGMRSYIPFGPFLVGGAMLALLTDQRMP